MLRKNLLIVFIVFLSACSDKVDNVLSFVKETTIKDTYNFCMKVNGNKKYCDCEKKDLEKSFPWKDYIKVVDEISGEENHIEKVIREMDGDRNKILAKLNCDTCVLTVALGAIDVSPSLKCVELFYNKYVQ